MLTMEPQRLDQPRINAKMKAQRLIRWLDPIVGLPDFDIVQSAIQYFDMGRDKRIELLNHVT